MSFVHFIELLFVVAILIAVGLPLFGKPKDEVAFPASDPKIDEFKHLLIRKEEVLISIKELEFDQKVDKISGEDYWALRNKLEKEAVTILERLDELESAEKKRRHSP